MNDASRGRPVTLVFTQMTRRAHYAGRRGDLRAIASQALNSLSNFLVLAAALWLPLDSYGALAAGVVVYVSVVGGVRAFILEPFTARAALASSGRRALAPVAALILPMSVAVLVVAQVAGDPLAPVLTLLALGLPIIALQDVGRYAAFARGRPGAAMVSDAGWVVFFIGALAVVRASDQPLSAEMMFAAWLGAGALSAAVLLPLVVARPTSRVPRLTRFDLGFGVDYLLGPLLLQAVQLTLVAIIPLAAYGQLRVATTVMGPVTVLFTATTSALVAFAVEQNAISATALASWLRRLRMGLVAVVGSYSLLVATAVATGAAFLPSSVRQSAFLLVPVGLGNVILAFDTPLILRLKACGYYAILARARAMQAVVALTAPLAASWWGVAGAAWALSGCVLAGYLVRVGLSNHRGLAPDVEPRTAGVAGR